MDSGSEIDSELLADYHRRILKEVVAKKVAGDILFSQNIGQAMRKWREYFGVKQSELARALGVSASVVSDYESSRRKSPGSLVLKRFVMALIEEDEKRGGTVLRTLVRTSGLIPLLSSVVDINEFTLPIELERFLEAIEGRIVVEAPQPTYVHGYTVIDSLKAILNLSGSDFMRLFGTSTERALIFTRVSAGRSPLVALKVVDVRPSLVVLHGLNPESVDDLGVKLASVMRVPLAVSTLKDVNELVSRLRELP
ncbi:MAG: helix-turn-helix domain-containing protein [Candidatus Korarchaeum sp.]|nr:helix-turn-helix domain-containing protein [Candidatus Korarchaeum sp.]MDW8035697.1 helix-turn-helix domain-containing protein [Candidatus Korarchaeum sp.]